MKSMDLPVVERKKIDLEKFEKLARKVKKIVIEENDYINKKHGNSASSRLLVDY